MASSVNEVIARGVLPELDRVMVKVPEVPDGIAATLTDLVMPRGELTVMLAVALAAAAIPTSLLNWLLALMVFVRAPVV